MWLVQAVIAAFTALAMEGWAALLHRWIWHRSMYRIHKTHHVKEAHGLQLNDLLSALHAPVAIALIWYGTEPYQGLASDLALGVGLGMTLFGLGYVVIHDGVVHGRLPVDWLNRLPWLARIKAAHRVHHALGGAPFGLFSGPWALRRANARRRALRAAPQQMA